jgi:capsular polysaccharide biosynthesis protein
MSTADVYRALWRHKFFIVVLTGILVAAAWYFTSRQTPIYQASTLVRVEQRVVEPGNDLGSLNVGERLAQTYANIVETKTIRSSVFARLGDRTAPDTRDLKLSAEPVESLELLWISARSPNPQLAADAANAVPPALRQFISAREQNGELTAVHRRVRLARRAAQVSQEEAAGAIEVSLATYQRLESGVGRSFRRSELTILAELTDQDLAFFGVALQSEAVVTVERAELPTSPVAPNLALNIALAVLLGLMFNGALALLIELLADRLRDADELEATLGRPVLAAIPVLTFRKQSPFEAPDGIDLLDPAGQRADGRGEDGLREPARG